MGDVVQQAIQARTRKIKEQIRSAAASISRDVKTVITDAGPGKEKGAHISSTEHPAIFVVVKFHMLQHSGGWFKVPPPLPSSLVRATSHNEEHRGSKSPKGSKHRDGLAALLGYRQDALDPSPNLLPPL